MLRGNSLPSKPPQQCIIPLSAKLAPGETKEIAVEPTCIFRPERLIVAEVQQTKLKIIWAFVRNLPIALLRNFLALFSEHACPGWKPHPYFPIHVLQFKVGSYKQFQDKTRIPAEVFSPHAGAINCRFDTCRIGQKLTLTVQSHAKQTILLRAGIIGTTTD